MFVVSSGVHDVAAMGFCCLPGSHAEGLEVGELTKTTRQLLCSRKLPGRRGAAAEAVLLQRESRQLCEISYCSGDLGVSCTPACKECMASISRNYPTQKSAGVSPGLTSSRDDAGYCRV